MDIRVQEASFDPGQILSEFQAGVQNAGAVVSFTGIVRDDAGNLDHMLIEHYPGMTEHALTHHAQSAQTRFGLSSVLVIHRFGMLLPNDTIMMVATAAKHRKDAFAGADYLMDFLKSRAPFWKKEVTSTGTTWVAARDTDEAALTEWGDDG